jgi:LysM repeat protein
MKKMISLSLAVLLLAVAAVPATAGACAASYTVKSGDTLRKIGAAYGVTWQSIASANNLANPNLIYVGSVLCIPGAAPSTPSVPSGPVPTITIVSVVADKSVTVQTANFPANQSFEVLMGPIGTNGVNGTAAGNFSSGKGGAQTATFQIPAKLKGSELIAIRLESTAYYSFNWFYNSTTQ